MSCSMREKDATKFTFLFSKKLFVFHDEYRTSEPSFPLAGNLLKHVTEHPSLQLTKTWNGTKFGGMVARLLALAALLWAFLITFESNIKTNILLLFKALFCLFNVSPSAIWQYFASSESYHMHALYLHKGLFIYPRKYFFHIIFIRK